MHAGPAAPPALAVFDTVQHALDALSLLPMLPPSSSPRGSSSSSHDHASTAINTLRRRHQSFGSMHDHLAAGSLRGSLRLLESPKGLLDRQHAGEV